MGGKNPSTGSRCENRAAWGVHGGGHGDDGIRRASVSMLFIHGDGTQMVPYEMMQELHDASSATKKEALTVIGAGHAKSKPTDSEKALSKDIFFPRAIYVSYDSPLVFPLSVLPVQSASPPNSRTFL